MFQKWKLQGKNMSEKVDFRCLKTIFLLNTVHTWILRTHGYRAPVDTAQEKILFRWVMFALSPRNYSSLFVENKSIPETTNKQGIPKHPERSLGYPQSVVKASPMSFRVSTKPSQSIPKRPLGYPQSLPKASPMLFQIIPDTPWVIPNEIGNR